MNKQKFPEVIGYVLHFSSSIEYDIDKYKIL